MKKLLSLLLMIVVLTSITPAQPAEAAAKISKSKATLEVDATLTLKITGAESKIAWTSSKETVATVNSKGTVTAIKGGTATITATVDSKDYTCSVYVVNSMSASIAVGETVEYTSGEYIVGDDIPSGTYTLEITSGYGAIHAYVTEKEFDNDGPNYKSLWLSTSNENETIYKNFKLKNSNYLVIDDGMIVEVRRSK